MKVSVTDLRITAENIKKFVDKVESKEEENRDDVELSNYTEPVKPTLGDHLGRPASEDITHADSCQCFKCKVGRAYDDIPQPGF